MRPPMGRKETNKNEIAIILKCTIIIWVYILFAISINSNLESIPNLV